LETEKAEGIEMPENSMVAPRRACPGFRIILYWTILSAANSLLGAIIGPKAILMRYTLVLEREADGGFVATVPALPGCVSQGDSRDEVMKNIRKAADLYIEDCIASGDPVPTEAGREYFELVTSI
jgi:predicted RNase H-like HicB family nuclease